ncbi:MAG TPA: DMT family transporter [Steroidobacteraceae bacterium]|nr:DMT family transporter [Steroidobacteraceae bacterium]
MHQVSGRWKLGFALALITSLVWSTLPIGLEVAFVQFDPQTVSWLRFLVSALILGGWLAMRGALPRLKGLEPKVWLLLAVSLAGIIGNYLLYAYALEYASPTVNQTVIQLAPMFLLLGGVVFMQERIGTAQRIGLVVLIAGLLLFFNQRLAEIASLSGRYFIGIVLLVLASIVWAAYGIAQKLLLRALGAQQILWLIYVGATVAMLPMVDLKLLHHVPAAQLIAVGYCCFNTLAGYGAFAAALEHWEVSRVGAVLATAPIFTLGAMWLTEHLWPGLLRPESLNGLAVVGAFAVVAGSIVSALGSRRAPA